MSDGEEKPSKRERRLARKILEEAKVAQAEETLKQASMLPRKRKRLAENTIKSAAQEKERLEQGKITVDQAKEDLKRP